jgi:CubicO group peptidase (beta-lactamase class C family)
MQSGWTHQDVLKFHRQIDGLNWQFGGENMHYNFLHRSEFLPHAVVYRGEENTGLGVAPSQDLAAFKVTSLYGRLPLQEYVTRAPVNGILFVQHGRIIYECYPRMRPMERHLLMSVTKALVSTVIALLANRGLLDVQQGVDYYLPSLRGSGWEQTPVQDVLDMSSGIDAAEVEEGFTNPAHPYYQYEASLGWLPQTGLTLESTYQYIASLRRKELPGQRYEYTSVNTFVLAWLAERLTGLALHEILTREIWGKIGAEADGLLAISKFGAPAAHAGFCATLRDVARFGLLFTPTGRAALNGTLVPAEYLRKIQSGGRPEIFDRGPSGQPILDRLHGEHPRHNIDQWDYVLEDGDFFKGGYGGQGLYISPRRDLVIAYFGTPLDANMQTHELEWITRQIVKAGLLDF